MSKSNKPATVKSQANASRETPKTKAAPPVADDDEPVDLETLRVEIARHTATYARYPRTCPHSVCRRNQRCLGRDLRCLRDHPLRPVSPEEEAEMIADVQQAIKRRLAELEAQGEGA